MDTHLGQFEGGAAGGLEFVRRLGDASVRFGRFGDFLGEVEGLRGLG